MENSSNRISPAYPERLTRAGQYLANALEEYGAPVVTNFEFFHQIWKMYAESEGKNLYLRHAKPDEGDFARLRQTLKKNGFVGPDRDYGTRILRILTVSDLPAEDIICTVDPTCYISHLSAMQRWGLTDRSPEELLLTRPDRSAAKEKMRAVMEERLYPGEDNPYVLQRITHPKKVRRRPVSVYETKTSGLSVKSRRDSTRLSTIGQTFLDMVQKPDLCGGMNHVMDVWDEHADSHLDEIVTAIDTAKSGLTKSRAGYILEERNNINHPTIDAWKALGQRGSSRRLDPSKDFASTFSETWMISLNA